MLMQSRNALPRHFTPNSAKCKYLIASREETPPSTTYNALFMGSDVLEQVDGYRYLGGLVTSIAVKKMGYGL